jgi:hypothetical protein
MFNLALTSNSLDLIYVGMLAPYNRVFRMEMTSTPIKVLMLI